MGPRATGALILVEVCCCISLCLHAPSFLVPHEEGDETVYLTLAREMNWDLSHYTTKDDPTISHFPPRIYRGPLFIHPPLFPYLLKIGTALGHPITFGLIVQNLAMILLFVMLWRVTGLLDLGVAQSIALFAMALCCPVLLFSTSKLHTDGLFSVFFFSGFVFFLEALRLGSKSKTALAALLLVIAFNIRLTGASLFPLLCCVQLVFLRRSKEPAFSAQGWKYFLGVMIPLLVFGGQHVFRLYLEYGAIVPDSFLFQKKEAFAWNPFLSIIFSRERWLVLVYLLMVFPLFVLPILPAQARSFLRSLRAGRYEGFFFLAFVYVLVLTVALDYQFHQFRQMRFFATVLPFLYVLVASRLSRATSIVIAVSLGLMLWTGIQNVLIEPGRALMIPPLVEFVPCLHSLLWR